MALKSYTVDAFVMGGVLESEFGGGEDTVDVGVPKAAGFGMTLEGVEDGEYHFAIEVNAVSFLVPFSVGVIDADKGRDAGRWRVGISIFGVTTVEAMVHGSRQSEKEPLDGLFNTRRVGVSNSFKVGCSFGRAIATIARASFAISLDAIGPLGAKDDGVLRRVAWFAIHGKSRSMGTGCNKGKA